MPLKTMCNLQAVLHYSCIGQKVNGHDFFFNSDEILYEYEKNTSIFTS